MKIDASEPSRNRSMYSAWLKKHNLPKEVVFAVAMNYLPIKRKIAAPRAKMPASHGMEAAAGMNAARPTSRKYTIMHQVEMAFGIFIFDDSCIS